MILSLLNDENLKQVVLDCQSNKSSAQEKLYYSFSKKVFGICLRYGADYAEAEDMLQEGFVKVFKNITKYDFSGSFPAWLSRVITNNCIDILRKKPSLYALTEDNSYHLESDSLSVIDELYAEDLMEIIHQLPIGYKTVFNMYVIEGYSHKEIAEKLDINEGTSKSQLNRARKLLQKKLIDLKELETSKHLKG